MRQPSEVPGPRRTFSKALCRSVCGRIAWRPLALWALAWCPAVHGQAHLVSEENLRDAILERRQFEAVEADSLDLNRDDTVDVADLTQFLLRTSNLVPSVSVAQYTQKVDEGMGQAGIELLFTRPFDAETVVSYEVFGTATAAGGAGVDFAMPGLNPSTRAGSFTAQPGETRALLPLTIFDDTEFGEGMETIRFSVRGGSPRTYYPGSLQTHLLYIDDNDTLWTAKLNMPDASGYQTLTFAITQSSGVFLARLIEDGKVIPRPRANDANRDGDDGWQVAISATADSLRAEIGPIPVDSSLSLFDCAFSRYYVLEVYPGGSLYRFDPTGLFEGDCTEILVPVKSRLGPPWPERAHLRREARGTFTMVKHPAEVKDEEVTLEQAP